MLQIQRWLSNWFAEWFSPECLPWILKLRSLHSFSHFNWQLNHSFRSSWASWLLNRFGKALYLVGWLAPGLVNARRSHPTNTAFRIRIRIRIVSALISWLLSISHLLSSSRASITSIHSIESIRDVRPFSTSGWLLRRQNAPWEHRGSHASSSDTRRATMQLDTTCNGYLPTKDPRRASPQPRWCRTTSIEPILTDERIRLEHLQPREKGKKIEKRGRKDNQIISFTRARNERTNNHNRDRDRNQFGRRKIATTNPQPHQTHISRTGSMWPGIEVISRQSIISISYLTIAARSADSIILLNWIWMRGTHWRWTMDNGRWNNAILVPPLEIIQRTTRTRAYP